MLKQRIINLKFGERKKWENDTITNTIMIQYLILIWIIIWNLERKKWEKWVKKKLDENVVWIESKPWLSYENM